MTDTVPLPAAQLVLGDDFARLALPASREIDLAAVADRAGPAAAARVRAYYEAARRFWAAPAGPWVRVERVLVDARQRTGWPRLDLHAELAAVEATPGLCAAARAALANPPPAALSGPLEYHRHATGARLVWYAPRLARWPVALGAAPGPGEVLRRVELDVRHAPWRDRRIRRLARVRVCVEEYWPDPAGWS